MIKKLLSGLARF